MGKRRPHRRRGRSAPKNRRIPASFLRAKRRTQYGRADGRCKPKGGCHHYHRGNRNRPFCFRMEYCSSDQLPSNDIMITQRRGKCKGFGEGAGRISKFFTTSPNHAHTARFHRALSCSVLDVTSLPFRKEVTKKRNQDVPSWISLSLPLCKEEKEKNIKFFTASLAAKLTRAAGVKK